MEKIITKPTPPSSAGNPAVYFNKDKFESVIERHGYEVVIEHAIACPCRSGDGQHRTDCYNCRGTGWVFINPRNTKALITSINRSTKYKNWSVEMIGTASVTTYFSERFSYMDRITMVNNETINNTSILSENLKIREIEGEDPFIFLTYKPINIESTFIFINFNTKLVRLIEGTDFVKNEDNPYIISFSYDFPIGFNGTISITYEHELQYHVLDMPHDVRNSYKVNNEGKDEQLTLPVMAIARKAFNVFEKTDYGDTGMVDNSY
jgi:hypothetical protein